MHRLLAIFVVCLLLASHARAENLSPRAFTAAFAAAATAAMPDAKVEIAADLHLETRGAGGDATSTDLHNAYQVYLNDPDHLDAIIRRYVGLLVETMHFNGAAPPVDRAHIVPILKPYTWAATILEQRKSTPEKLLLTEPFNQELTIVYAEDRPSSVRFLMMGDDVGDRAKLHDVALANLERLLPKIEMRAGADGVFLVTAGGQYEASLLLANDIWSSGQIRVDGDIVAAVPAKDVLIVTGSRDAKGIARLHKLAAELARGPYALTPALFIYQGGKFVVFDGN